MAPYQAVTNLFTAHTSALLPVTYKQGKERFSKLVKSFSLLEKQRANAMGAEEDLTEK